MSLSHTYFDCKCRYSLWFLGLYSVEGLYQKVCFPQMLDSRGIPNGPLMYGTASIACHYDRRRFKRQIPQLRISKGWVHVASSQYWLVFCVKAKR